MDADLRRCPIDVVVLELGDVVGHVVDEPHIIVVDTKDPREYFPRLVHDDLPVCPGIICSTGHTAVVSAALWRVDRSTGKLPVREAYPVFSKGSLKYPQVIGGDLVAETP